MTREVYEKLEAYMCACMADSAHDRDHIYRVLYTALDIAQTEPKVDYDILITACLLHDIGRKEQFENPALCHAQVGARKAYRYLTEQGFSADFSEQVAHCISTHRFRGDNPPQSIEAKILFDADKIDATGTLGIARTLLYNGKLGEPLYSLDEGGIPSDGTKELTPSFLQEYNYKLKRVYEKLLTARGRELGEERRRSAVAFYEALLSETQPVYEQGKSLLDQILEKEK